jgi:hypothetical protein
MEDDRDGEIIDGFLNDNDDPPLPEELVVKPALCLSCKKDNDPNEEELCMLTRLDSEDGGEFICGAYEKA